VAGSRLHAHEPIDTMNRLPVALLFPERVFAVFARGMHALRLAWGVQALSLARATLSCVCRIK